MERVRRLSEEAGGAPAVVCGDFNSAAGVLYIVGVAGWVGWWANGASGGVHAVRHRWILLCNRGLPLPAAGTPTLPQLK